MTSNLRRTSFSQISHLNIKMRLKFEVLFPPFGSFVEFVLLEEQVASLTETLILRTVKRICLHNFFPRGNSFLKVGSRLKSEDFFNSKECGKYDGLRPPLHWIEAELQITTETSIFLF